LTHSDKKKYEGLSHEDFDAIVTGELAHYTIWFDEALVKIISDFLGQPSREDLFKRLLLRREGLTVQDKIEIVSAMIPEFSDSTVAGELKQTLRKIEKFKTDRNAFAHGLDVTPKPLAANAIHIQTVTRAGKEKTIVITPETHVKTIDDAEKLLEAVTSISKKLEK